MNIPTLTTSTLHEFHEKIRECLKKDDNNPSKEKEFYTREFPDFRKMADAIEQELTNRNIQFTPIPW